MRFTIDREKWLRGETYSHSRLYRLSDGKKCCLGFYLEACGIEKEHLKVKSPADVKCDLPESTSWLIATSPYTRHGDSDDSRNLMEANDSAFKSDRETTIVEIFARHGIEVDFVDAI